VIPHHYSFEVGRTQGRSTQEREIEAARLTWPQPGKAQANVSFSLPSFPLPLPSAAGDPNPSSSFRVTADCLLAGISRIFYASVRLVSRRNTVRRAESEFHDRGTVEEHERWR
jgi:hypothetical protein